MSNTVLTLAQLKVLFQNWTVSVTNFDPSMVRNEWPLDGAPGWRVTDDICFLAVRYHSDGFTDQMSTEYSEADASNANSTQVYTRGHNVTWVFYGANSYDNADAVRSYLFTDSMRTLLASSNLALIPQVNFPVRVPENRNGQWFDRTSFTANFYELVQRQATVPYIQSVDWNLKQG